MAKEPTKKTAAKKAATKKTATKKAAVKKTVTKKVAAKKAVTKKVAAKKTATKKVAAKKATKKVARKAATPAFEAESVTSIVAKIDIGFGNTLFIRGEGAGLSWDAGIEMENLGTDEWVYTAKSAVGEVVFKTLLNDEIWSDGDDVVVKAGEKSVIAPSFIL